MYYHQHFPALLKEVAKMVKEALKKERSNLGSEVPAFVDAGACISYSAMTGLDLAVDGLDNFPECLDYAGVFTLVSGRSLL